MLEYRNTLGTVAAQDGKVHLAHGNGDNQKVLCRFGAKALCTDETLTDISNDERFTEALFRAEVKVSKLCKNCFNLRMRAEYIDFLRG